ncbi:MAG: zf-HC2 domain-containing protein [Erythrobacter sp.]
MSLLTFNVPRNIKGVVAKLPMMIDCQGFEDFLVDYFDGNLTKHQRIIFELHLRFCGECRDFLRAYEAAQILARKTGEAVQLNINNAPDDLVTAIVSALDKPYS